MEILYNTNTYKTIEKDHLYTEGLKTALDYMREKDISKDRGMHTESSIVSLLKQL